MHSLRPGRRMSELTDRDCNHAGNSRARLSLDYDRLIFVLFLHVIFLYDWPEGLSWVGMIVTIGGTMSLLGFDIVIDAK